MQKREVFESQSLADWLFYLEQQHHKEIDLGLERVKSVADKASVGDFGSTQTVLVAGTNGKGTTIRFIEQYLLLAGFSVGVYSSPHIIEYNERVRINGSSASDDVHLEAFRHIEACRKGTNLTYFEFGTLAGLYALEQQKLDYVLVEVGLGGRLDATNIFEHDVAVITSIGLDHTDWLGDSLDQIAFEKAGIFRPNKPAVIGEPAIYKGFDKQIKELHPNAVYQVGKEFSYQVTDHVTEQLWSYQTKGLELNGLPLSLIPIQNIATALTTLHTLGVELVEQKVKEVISGLSLPGRMQIISEQPCQMLDAAHNAHAMKYLFEALSNHPLLKKFKKIEVVLGMMKDKDISSALSVILPKVNYWHLASFSGNSRAATAEELGEYLSSLKQTKFECYSSVTSAWEQAKLNQSEDTLLLGFGSFYTVAEILNHFEVKSD